MADRGDVFQLKRRLGFGADQEAERVVIVQASPLNSVLPTMIAVPLEPLVETFAASPLAVTVSALEAGSMNDHVAVTSWLHVVRSDRLAPGRVGRLLPPTMRELGDKLRLVLGL